VAILQQFPLAVFLGLAPRHLGLSRGNVGFGDFEVLLELLWVEPRQEVALFDRRPDINRPLEDLAVDPEADIGLMARLYLAG
jgi:hypothetical protein